MKLRTLDMVPAMDGRRFTVLELGSLNVATVRDEHRLLLNIVATVVGVPADEVTQEHLRAVDLERLHERLHGAPAE